MIVRNCLMIYEHKGVLWSSRPGNLWARKLCNEPCFKPQSFGVTFLSLKACFITIHDYEPVRYLTEAVSQITSTAMLADNWQRMHCHRIWYTIAFGIEYCQVQLKLRHFVQMRNIASMYQLAHTSICLHYFYRKAEDNNERKVVFVVCHTLSTIYISALMLHSELFFSRNSSAVIFISPTQVFVIFREYALLQGFTHADYKISFCNHIYMQNSGPGIFPAKVVKQLHRIGHHSHSSSAKFHIDSKYFHGISAQILSQNANA